ncbi:MAG TPA: response regulator transcription factor [Chloroflexota bacterium]|nr:response regulator transcription factor [Chloroflexota bacterium]
MSGPRILIVDTETAIRRMLCANLAAHGYDVMAMETGEAALRYTCTRRPDLVILDVLLPGLSELDLCHRLRAESAVPILVLSAHGEERIKVRALDLGADDYVTKPCGIDELLARVRALLRRPASMPVATATVTAGAFVVDLDRHQAWCAGAALDLTRRELAVLLYLLQPAGRVVPHRLLLTEVWGPEYDTETHYLRVFIHRLRRKIEQDPAHPRTIVTEPGVGYRMLADVPSGAEDGCRLA